MSTIGKRGFEVRCDSCRRDLGVLERTAMAAGSVARAARWRIVGRIATCPACRIKAGMRCQFNARQWHLTGTSCHAQAEVLHHGPFGARGPFFCDEHEGIVHRSDVDNMVG